MPNLNLIQRQHLQAARVDAGVRQGQLTPEQAAALNAQRAAAHQQIRTDRADGRGMTLRERHQDHLLLNRSSQAIFQQRWGR